ncbi:MAG: carboxymuconolactone decarboxylase family protein, partial [Gammaproteobacteria bacterium]
MTRLTLHTVETAPSASRPFVEKAIANNGFLPNLIGVLANSPPALETYLTVSGINARSTLTLAEREAVQITAARVHGCEFCVAGHTAVALKKANLDPDTVAALQAGDETGDPRLDSVQRFSEAVIAQRGGVSDAELKAFRSAGFDDA